jgi:hypothetical protein
MLTKLRLENYRGFADHVIPFEDLTVLVGRNNAGKSTTVEALRLLGEVVRRFRSSDAFREVPSWLMDPRAFRGVSPVIRDIDFHDETFFHAYSDPPAVVTGTFSDGSSVNVFVGPFGYVHGVARGKDGHAVGSAAQARNLNLTALSVQPQLGPVLRDERILTQQTVMRGLATSPSIHFRNQLNLFYESFPDFKKLSEETWPQVQILELQGQGGLREEPLHLLLRDGPFVADVGLMGHGLQMWLQTMWFITRTPASASVVLDEPDVYMHPDLQHRLLATVATRFRQVVVATHSVEIVTTTDPRSLVVVDRSRSRSRPLASLAAAQAAIEDLGGVQSVHVARLYGSERFLMVEGKDVLLLAAFQSSVIPDSKVPIGTVPFYETSGWGGWQHAIRSNLPRKNGEGKPILTYCLFDSDYHTQAEIGQRYAEADQHKVNLHVWDRKEIENYVLEPEPVARLIARRIRGKSPPSPDEVAEKIKSITRDLRADTVLSLADELDRRDRSLGVKRSHAEAKKQVAERWESQGGSAVVSGKTVLKRLKEWSATTFGVSFSAAAIAREMRCDEVPEEIRLVLEAIEGRHALPPSLRSRA